MRAREDNGTFVLLILHKCTHVFVLVSCFAKLPSLKCVCHSSSRIFPSYRTASEAVPPRSGLDPNLHVTWENQHRWQSDLFIWPTEMHICG